MTPAAHLEQLLVLRGGRAAERTFFGSATNGASGDLEIARKIARKMVHEWGMGEKLYQALLEQETLTHGEVMALLDLGQSGAAQG